MYPWDSKTVSISGILTSACLNDIIVSINDFLEGSDGGDKTENPLIKGSLLGLQLSKRGCQSLAIEYMDGS
ncbi:MAG: hypothetical protein LBF12_04890 [Christensenellaceae bacterium]|nr:hypothetical protein [Christensenellaceae bacterium]